MAKKTKNVDVPLFPDLPVKRKKKLKSCITGCGRKPRTDNFCGNCYTKFLKGHFLKNGTKHPDVIAKEKAIAIKREKKSHRENLKNKLKEKEFLKTNFTKDLLKVLQDSDTSVAAPKYCPHWDFWTSDAICYGRLFISKKKDCEDCHDHDSKFSNLKTFIEDSTNDKKSTNGAGFESITVTNTGTRSTGE